MKKKTNPILAQQEAMLEARYRRKLEIATQMGLDAGMIAANEVLNLGPGRAAAFRTAYVNAMNDMAALLAGDGNDDRELVYSTEVIDRRIKSIVGPENFQPWEVRYGG